MMTLISFSNVWKNMFCGCSIFILPPIIAMGRKRFGVTNTLRTNKCRCGIGSFDARFLLPFRPNKRSKSSEWWLHNPAMWRSWSAHENNVSVFDPNINRNSSLRSDMRNFPHFRRQWGQVGTLGDNMVLETSRQLGERDGKSWPFSQARLKVILAALRITRWTNSVSFTSRCTSQEKDGLQSCTSPGG